MSWWGLVLSELILFLAISSLNAIRVLLVGVGVGDGSCWQLDGFIFSCWGGLMGGVTLLWAAWCRRRSRIITWSRWGRDDIFIVAVFSSAPAVPTCPPAFFWICCLLWGFGSLRRAGGGWSKVQHPYLRRCGWNGAVIGSRRGGWFSWWAGGCRWRGNFGLGGCLRGSFVGEICWSK